MRVHIWCSTEDGSRCATCNVRKTPASANMFCRGMPEQAPPVNPHHPFPFGGNVCPRCGMTRRQAHTERQPFCPAPYRSQATQHIARVYHAASPWVAQQLGVVFGELAARPECAPLLRYWHGEQAVGQGEG